MKAERIAAMIAKKEAELAMVEQAIDEALATEVVKRLGRKARALRIQIEQYKEAGAANA